MFPLQTSVAIPNPGFHLDYSKKLLLLGSCFADNIGSKLELLKFPVLHNPFGIIYNPASLANNLKLLLDKGSFQESSLGFHNELWFSFNHHSTFSSLNKQQCLQNINEQLKTTRKFLKETDLLFLTLGTSWIYQYKKTNQVVNNCHKIPAKEFNRVFLRPNDTVQTLQEIINQLLKNNPKLRIVFTVSPIRHLKDGAIENQRSKASLLLAIKELEQIYPVVYYFPSYEIFMDELRDYRYYDSDMTHPSNIGIDYLWDRFQNTFIDQDTLYVLKKIEKIQKGILHRPLNTETVAYSKFIRSLKQQCEKVMDINPEIDLSAELNGLRQIGV